MLSARGRCNDGTQEVYLDDELQGTVTSDFSIKGGKSPSHLLNGYYVGKVGKVGIDANVSFYWSDDTETKSVTEESREMSSRQVTTDNAQHSVLRAGKLILSYPVGESGKVNLGSEVSVTRSEGESYNHEGYVARSSTEIHEDHEAGFCELAMPVGSWHYNLGVRYEAVSSRYYDHGVYRDDVSRWYSDWFPSASVSWKGTELSYAYKTRRPSYHSLRNEVQYDNRYFYEGGNPFLQPSKSHCFDLNVNHSWWSLSAGYTYTHDAMIWCTSLYDGQDGIAYTSNQNFDHLQEAYASVVLSPKFGWYQPVLELDYSQEWFDASQYGSAKPSYKPYFVIDLKNRLVLPHNLTVLINLRQNTDNYSGFQVVRHSTRLNAQIIKSFFDRALTLNLRLNDLLGQNERWSMYGIQTIVSKDCYNYTRNVTLTVTYNLNASKSKYKGTGAGQSEMRRL